MNINSIPAIPLAILKLIADNSYKQSVDVMTFVTRIKVQAEKMEINLPEKELLHQLGYSKSPYELFIFKTYKAA